MLKRVAGLLFTLAVSAGAVELHVAASGGNESSPLMYGIMFEVGGQVVYALKHTKHTNPLLKNHERVLITSRISITVEMVACMLN